MIDFTGLIVWLISAAAAALAAFLGAKAVPFLRQKGLYAFTACAVKAAVTYFSEGQGKAKFQWVFARVQEKYGKFFDAEAIKDAVQGAYVDLCIALGKTPSPME